MDVAFMSANFVARASGYDGHAEWRTHEVQTREQDIDFDFVDEWMGAVSGSGFEAVSLWTAHCWYHDVTDAEIERVRALADENDLAINAYAGDFGFAPGREGLVTTDREHWERTYEVADALGCDWLEGLWGADENRELIRELGEDYDVGFGYEPHFVDSPAEAIERTAGYEDAIGIVLDTGSAGEYGYSAPDAVRAYGDRLMNVHLKDVREPGAHRCVALGEGIVDVAGTLDALTDIGYEGPITVEHEPYDRDPMPEVRTSIERIRAWQRDR